MNFWAVASGIDGEVDRTSIVEAFRSTEDQPSFNGHPFTCDGEQMPDLQGLCAPQQILLAARGVDDFEQLGDWIDVPAVIDAART
jgi:branched-chain amino acid transport system substrate-binding protein